MSVVNVTLIVAVFVSLTPIPAQALGICTPVFWYYHGDHLGSTGVITDRNGALVWHYEYFAFGKEKYSNTACSFSPSNRYTGQILDDDTGLYCYNARYGACPERSRRDPEIGRFIQPDTIVPSAGDPQSLNRYSYVRNNPLMCVAPTGHYGIHLLNVQWSFEAGAADPTSDNEPSWWKEGGHREAPGKYNPWIQLWPPIFRKLGKSGNAKNAPVFYVGNVPGAGFTLENTAGLSVPSINTPIEFGRGLVPVPGIDVPIDMSGPAFPLSEPPTFDLVLSGLAMVGPGTLGAVVRGFLAATGVAEFAKEPNLGNGIVAGLPFVPIAKGVRTADQYALVAAEDGFYPVLQRGFSEPQGGCLAKSCECLEIWKDSQSRF